MTSGTPSPAVCLCVSVCLCHPQRLAHESTVVRHTEDCPVSCLESLQEPTEVTCRNVCSEESRQQRHQQFRLVLWPTASGSEGSKPGHWQSIAGSFCTNRTRAVLVLPSHPTLDGSRRDGRSQGRLGFSR